MKPKGTYCAAFCYFLAGSCSACALLLVLRRLLRGRCPNPLPATLPVPLNEPLFEAACERARRSTSTRRLAGSHVCSVPEWGASYSLLAGQASVGPSSRP